MPLLNFMTFPPKRPLSESEFIRENSGKNPIPAWLWLFLVTIVLSVMWGANSWFFNLWQLEIAKSPFLQVTNREMSVFLWQFPEHMRVNAKNKGGYLTGFQYQDKITVFPELADEYVVAPPGVLFLYHTWNRLMGNEIIPRSIPIEEFKEFLSYAEEWLPQYWKKAPQYYLDFIKNLNQSDVKDLSSLPDLSIPLQVRQSFQGWKNFFKEGEAINKISPSFTEVQTFLKRYPYYARPYWQNILLKSYPNYLLAFTENNQKAVGPDQMAPFLRVALFNYLHSDKK
jgi:hypothetical protein